LELRSGTAGVRKLGLGTVQFGLDYGISNAGGKTAPDEVRRILAAAAGDGLRVLDTASLYGESEEVLGGCWPARHDFRVVTKTPRLTGPDAPELLERTLARSLKRLGLDAVYGLLVHHADDLLSPRGAPLVRRLETVRDRGLAQRIGFSCYSAAEIDAVLQLFTPDLVQLPLNVFDQRLLASGHMEKLKERGVEIHARSVFLQGLLLMAPEVLPPYFEPLKQHLAGYRRALAEASLTPLEAALGFATGLDQVDAVLVGVNNLSQLQEISGNACCIESSFFADFSIADAEILTPSNWRFP
jgi:aryl-alcohol dehydrogenase-like predicted oxidoreductase